MSNLSDFDGNLIIFSKSSEMRRKLPNRRILFMFIEKLCRAGRAIKTANRVRWAVWRQPHCLPIQPQQPPSHRQPPIWRIPTTNATIAAIAIRLLPPMSRPQLLPLCRHQRLSPPRLATIILFAKPTRSHPAPSVTATIATIRVIIVAILL